MSFAQFGSQGLAHQRLPPLKRHLEMDGRFARSKCESAPSKTQLQGPAERSSTSYSPHYLFAEHFAQSLKVRMPWIARRSQSFMGSDPGKKHRIGSPFAFRSQ